MPSRYVATLQNSGLRLEVLVNDIPVLYMTPSESSPTVVPLNAFAMTGKNAISLLVHASPSTIRADQPWKANPVAAGYLGEGQCSLSVSRVVDGPSSAERVGPELGAVSWSGEATPVPTRVDGTFTIAEQLGPWRWQEADDLRGIWQTAQRDVTDYIQRLHDMLRAGRFGDFMAESDTKIREFATAFSLDVAQLRAGMQEQLALNSKPPATLTSIDPNTFELRLVAGGRLVQCSAPGRGYLLEYRQPDSTARFFLPLMVGRERGVWRVFR